MVEMNPLIDEIDKQAEREGRAIHKVHEYMLKRPRQPHGVARHDISRAVTKTFLGQLEFVKDES